MKKIFQFVPTYIVLFLILGIITGYYFSIDRRIIIFVLLAEIVIFAWLFVKVNIDNSKSIYFSFFTFLISFSIGIASISIKNQLNSRLHYYYLITQNPEKPDNNYRFYEVKVMIAKVLKPGTNYRKYEVEVLEVNHVKRIGKTLLNVLADSSSIDFKVDQTLLLFTSFKPIDPPKNPFYFDYQSYLSKQQIHHQFFVTKNELKLLNENKQTIRGLAAKLRSKINNKLEPFHIKNDELSVINALLLGQRQDISADLMDSYKNAGAVHILAVSGLHIGIILLILNILLSPIERLKKGKILKILLLVVLLWLYAIIAGLSPSIVRAVMMFSVIAVGMNLNKNINIMNTLIVSILILLLINPYYLFDVGFQMSYAAVFSIVIFQPILQSFWSPKNRFLKFYWDLLTVSIGAQFGVLPLSLFYFHQFPGLFMVTNLIIIPFLGIILMGGILVFGLALLNLLPTFLVSVYTFLIYMMNWTVKMVSSYESFLIKEIHFDLWMMLSLYFFFFA